MKALKGNDANREETHCAKYEIQTENARRQKTLVLCYINPVLQGEEPFYVSRALYGIEVQKV